MHTSKVSPLSDLIVTVAQPEQEGSRPHRQQLGVVLCNKHSVLVPVRTALPATSCSCSCSSSSFTSTLRKLRETWDFVHHTVQGRVQSSPRIRMVQGRPPRGVSMLLSHTITVLKKMKLLTHNMLTSHVKGVKNGYPLGVLASQVVVKAVDFNAEFIARMIPKVDWGALRTTAQSVSTIICSANSLCTFYPWHGTYYKTFNEPYYVLNHFSKPSMESGLLMSSLWQ